MILLLSLGGLLLFSIPSVQTHLVNRFTQKIYQNLETEIKVEGVAIGFDGTVNLASFYIADHHSDTLFYAKNFKTDLYSLGQWVNGNLFFSSTEFENIILKNTHYEGEEKNSLFYFNEKLLAHSKPNNDLPVFVRIDELKITDGRFLSQDKNKSNKSLEFQNINLKANDFFLISDGLEMSLNNLIFDSNDYGTVNLNAKKLFYNPCSIDMQSFQLSSGYSIIEGNINLFFPNEGFNALKENIHLNFFLDGIFSRHELQNFVDLPENFKPIKFKLSATGKLNDIKFSNLEISQEAIELKAKLDVQQIFSDLPLRGFAELEYLNIISANLFQIIPSAHYDKFLKPLLRYDPFECGGMISIENNQLSTDLLLNNGKASIINRSLFDISHDQGKFKLNSFSSNSSIEKFDLSPWHPTLGMVTSKLMINGNRVAPGDLDINFDIDFDEIFILGERINKLQLNGLFKEKELAANILVEDNFTVASSKIAYSWGEDQNKFQLDLNLEELNLHLMNQDLGGGKAVYSGDINLFAVGNTFDELQGNLLFKNIQFESQTQVDFFNDFILETSLTNQNRTIRTINSDIIDINIEGGFQLSKLNSLFSNAVAEVFPILKKNKIEFSQDLVYDISVQTEHLNAVFPDLVIDKKAFFRGVLSTQDNISKMKLNIPRITFKGINTEDLTIQLDNQNPLFNTYVSVEKIESNSIKISEFSTLGVKVGDSINFRTEFYGGKNKYDTFRMNYALFLDEAKLSILVKPSIVEFNRNVWNINSSFDQKHLLQYNYLTDRIDLNFFEAQSGNERIEIKANYNSKDDFGLSLLLDKVSIQNLAISTDDFNLKGAMDLNLNIKRSPSDNTLDFNGFVDDFVINDLDMGTLRFFTQGNTQLNSYEVNLRLFDKEKNSLLAKGNILGFDKSPRLDLDFSFNDFDLSFLTPIGRGDVDKIRGNVTGNVNLWGPIDAPNHNGQLILNQGGLSIPYINTDYLFSNGTIVSLVDQTFNFNKTKLTDTKFGTQAELVGQINHLNFSNWGFDINVVSERILMLNVDEREDEVFFGNGFLGGKVHLHGPSKNLTIDVVGATEEGTSIKIPWADDFGLADTSFMKFIDKKKVGKTQQKKNEELYNFSGLEMNFELDVNDNAEIKVVIDKESGSFLSGHGAGNILMEIDTKGKFNMWGDFITFDGIYNFKNLNVIDKKFNLRQGGTIVWEGDPLGAQMDLEAVYEVPGGANPAILLDNPNFNRKIPTEVLIRLQGNLLKPDDPIFEIDFPNTSAVVTSEINYRLADPQISQLQAISLLSQGIFINEVSVSVQGITNNLYEKASDLLSNLMGDDNGKIQVGLNYLQGDKSKVMDINSDDRLGLTLSTQITDKILLNGKIGVPVGGIEETLIVGDLQIDFILNEEGSLKAKVFNKENEFRYIGDELGYTQGVGLSYQVDFETFRELIGKIVKGNQLSQTKQSKQIVSKPSGVGINFINKN